MVDIPSITTDSISATVSKYFQLGFAQAGEWASYIIIAAIILAIFFFIWLYMAHNIKITYFTLYGDPENKDNCILGKIKKDRGRIVKRKGIPKLTLFWARQEISDIAYKYIYPDGVWMVRKSKKEFAIVQRPIIQKDTSGKFSSIVVEPYDRDLDLINIDISNDLVNRLRDEDSMKRQQMITMFVLIGCFVLAAVVIWLSYSYHNAALSKTSQVVSALDKVASKIGIGG